MANEIVRGGCPSCRRGGLALGEEGHIYCTHADCPNPRAADQLLRLGSATPGMNYTVGGRPAIVPTFRGARPEIVCLCGSTRFVDHFNDWRARLTYKGAIVLSIEIVTTQARDEDPQHVDPDLKRRLDELHLRKIDLADRVLVLNVGGYIGESTRAEVVYARATGTPIDFLEGLAPEDR